MENKNKNKGTSLLSRIDIQELKVIKVAIKRHNIIEPPSPQPIVRTLDDPATLLIHRRGEGQRPIFDRDDIVVNQENEERVVLTSSQERASCSSGSRSCSRGRRSQSASRKRSKSRSASKKRKKSSRSPRRSSRSPRRSSRSPRRSSRSPRRSSRSPRRSRSASGERRRQEKRAVSRDRSPSKSVKYRSEYREWRTRQSRSPEKPKEKQREPASPPRPYRKRSPPLRPGEYRPPKKKSVSPRKDREKEHEPVAGPSHIKDHHSEKYHEKERRRSKSPYKSSRSPRRRMSRSPHRPEKKERRRSRSPRYRDAERSRRYSRSPHYRDDYRDRYEHRSKRYSPSPPSYRNQPPVIPQPHFKAGGVWIPDSMLAHSYIPGFFPPGPRPIIRGPRMPPILHPIYQPRPPRIYNQPYRARLSAPTAANVPAVSISEINTENSSAVLNSSSAVDTTTEGVASSNVEEQPDGGQN